MKVITQHILAVCAWSIIVLSGSVLATEFRTVHDAGIDANSIGIGNVTGFSSSALGVLESPVGVSSPHNETSLYYTSLMESDVTVFAGATKFDISEKIQLSLGMVQELTDAGYETASANNTVTAIGSLSYESSEYVANTTVQLSRRSQFGVTGHYISRDQFGIKGSAVGVSAGYRYESRRLGMSVGGRYINAPKINYSNGGTETLNTQWYIAGKRRLQLFPADVYAQLDWVPNVSVIKKGTGIRVGLTEAVSVSAGYMESRGIGYDVQGHWTAGTSVNLGVLRIDYAYNSVDYIADSNQHRIMLSFLY